MNKLHFLLAAAICAIALAPTAHAAEPPPGQRILLSSLSPGSDLQTGAWQMNATAAEAASPSITPKFGGGSLTFRGTASIPGAKGDFGVAGQVLGACRSLEIWVHLAPDANCSTVGLQFHDSEGESLFALVPADWTGWKLLTFDLASQTIAQPYPQKEKNGRVDLPLRAIHVVWFAKAAGPSSVTVNELVALTDASADGLPVQAAFNGPRVGEPGVPYSGRILLTNYTAADLSPVTTYSIQRDSSYYSTPQPDPVYGPDRAEGAKSWTVEDGKIIEEGSLTDGRDWTSGGTGWGKHTELLQYVDLGRTLTIRRMAFKSGDSNWIFKVDIAASGDGKQYTPVAGLQGLDWHGRWGETVVPVAEPFAARFLRLRYHKDGEVANCLRTESALMVYSGSDGAAVDVPVIGETVASGAITPQVPARSFAAADIVSKAPLSAGAYLVSAKVVVDGKPQLFTSHYFVMPPAMAKRTLQESAASRFGLNTALVEFAPRHQRLGIGWVRFENMKWPMISPKPDDYRFDGSVGPWNVQHDKIVEGYTSNSLNVLPFLFMTPDYATSAPPTVKQGRWASYPPKDNSLYADFTYQTAARYGATKHQPSDLKTPDKLSGLGKVNAFELWNEPNLTDPGWGPWVGTTAQYLEMFRAGAEGIKRADPTAKVTNGGTAGIDIDVLDPLASYRYADGKRPLDFVDVLNVHYYSGQIAPEIASVDGNADRSGAKTGGRTFEEDLRRMVAWRNDNKPGLPIWMTETGYDSAGPFGTNERVQAARLPRVIMMILAAGIDKVFVYRESGSTPSMHACSGLQRNDGSLKPSWFTYATLIRQLDRVTSGTRLPYPDPNVRLYAWKRGAETIVTGWTVEGAAEIPMSLGACTVTDAFGSASQRNLTTLPLTIYPVYITNIANLAPITALADKGRQADEARDAEAARQKKLRAYLYDFGSTDIVGSVEVGNAPRFTPVVAKDVYSDDKGYGFTPNPAMSDEVWRWITDPLDRDGCRVEVNTHFHAKVAPGQYHVKLSVEPLGDSVNVTLGGIEGGDKVLAFTKASTTVETDIAVGTANVVVSFSGYAFVRWLSIIEK
ncbi:MAG TPA: hypothetical protein VGK19_23955 [Capsulimonadaceae bacterium]